MTSRGATDSNDRSSIKSLYALLPKNHRDASGTQIWKNDKPTPISVPSSKDTQNHSSTSLNPNRFGGSAASPYSLRNMGGPVGNKTRGRKYLLDHPNQSMALAHNVPMRGASIFVLDPEPKPNATLMQAINRSSGRSPTTYISSDEEDTGVLVQSDPMNITDDEDDKPYIPRYPRPSLPVQRPPTHTFETFHSHAGSQLRGPSGPSRLKDGPATMELEKQLDAHRAIQSDSIDSIEQFTDEERPALGVSVRKGNVREKVEKIENNGVKPVPRIDLRKMQPHLKNQMKPKAKPKDVQDGAPTSASPYFDTGPRRATTQIKKPLLSLHVKEWFLGTELRNSKHGYYLQWDKSTKKISLHEGEPGSGTAMLAFQVGLELTDLQFSSTNFQTDSPIISFNSLSINAKDCDRNTQYFEMGGTHRQGTIIVKFDARHKGWSDKDYKAFVDWLKTLIKEKSTLGKAATKSVWDAAIHASEHHHSALVKRKRISSAEEIKPNARPRKRFAHDDDLDAGGSTLNDRFDQSNSNSRESTVASSRSASVNQTRAATNAKPEPTIFAPRRSSRQVAARNERSPSADPDEIILCYPQGLPGAVNITNADFKRLQPGEFLNDTLIEFGLKRWLRRLDEVDPELAKQIHVFSSFFYKKLNKKNIEEGYESVRKWTSKFDLFSKKYIIVPINEHLHWYLAIIYQPEHVLIPPLAVPESPRTRRKAQHIVPQPSVSQLNFSSPTDSTPPMPPETQPAFERLSSESVVENNLLNFDASCSITVTTEDSSRNTPSPTMPEVHVIGREDVPSSPITEMDIDDDNTTQAALQARSPSVSDLAIANVSRLQGADDIEMEDTISDAQPPIEGPDSLFGNDAGIDYASESAIKPQNFYSSVSTRAQGKLRASPPPEVPSSIQQEDEDDAPSSGAVPTTYIFTLDSLGSKHPQAIKQLTRYLKLEAQDKRKLSDSSDPRGKMAFVPVQPNYCDCGLYLLHFAQTFVTDPEKYSHIINTRKRGTSITTRQEDWDESKLGNMRETMANDILRLSVEWKRERAAKEKAKKKDVDMATGVGSIVESSDDEVDIVDTTPVTADSAAKGKGVARNSASKAKRLRG